MSTVYDEGIFQNWTGVSFPGGLYVVGFINIPGVDTLLSLEPWPIGRTPSSGKEFQGLLTGAQSGNTLDVSLVPYDVGAPANVIPSLPPCVRTVSNLYDLNGNLLTTTPLTGYNVRATGVLATGLSSYSVSGPSCASDANAPLLTSGWIINERVSVQK